MTRINHFQIYSGRENHVTDNTMLMMRHVYRVSPLLVARLLTSSLDTEVSVGLEFAQQERGLESIPDAAMTQAPMFIYFEAKQGGGGLFDDQMQRHLRSIADRKHSAGLAFLIGLTWGEPPLADRERCSAMGKADGIQLASKTCTDNRISVNNRVAKVAFYDRRQRDEMLRIAPVMVAIAVMPVSAIAGPSSYICSVEGYHVTPGREDWADTMDRWTISVDRKTGRTVHPALGNTSYNHVFLLNPGSGDSSFKVMADSGGGGNVKYMIIEEFVEEDDKPFVVVDNGDVYWGSCL